MTSQTRRLGAAPPKQGEQSTGLAARFTEVGFQSRAQTVGAAWASGCSALRGLATYLPRLPEPSPECQAARHEVTYLL